MGRGGSILGWDDARTSRGRRHHRPTFRSPLKKRVKIFSVVDVSGQILISNYNFDIRKCGLIALRLITTHAQSDFVVIGTGLQQRPFVFLRSSPIYDVTRRQDLISRKRINTEHFVTSLRRQSKKVKSELRGSFSCHNKTLFYVQLHFLNYANKSFLIFNPNLRSFYDVQWKGWSLALSPMTSYGGDGAAIV